MKKINILLITSSLICLSCTCSKSNNLNLCIPSPSPELKYREEILKLLPKNGIIAEIGVWDGQFSEQILKYCNPKHLYLIDGWAHQKTDEYPDGLNWGDSALYNVYQKVLKRFENDHRVTVIKAFSPEAAELFENNFFDCVYIDGNHKYEAVKKDLIAWYNKVKTGGIISGHDYFVSPQHGSTYYGVVKAVNEFLFNNKLELLFLTVEQVPSYAFIKK